MIQLAIEIIEKSDEQRLVDHWAHCRVHWELRGRWQSPAVAGGSNGEQQDWLFWVLVISPWHAISMKAIQGRTLISAHSPGHGIRPGGEGAVVGEVGGSRSPSIHSFRAGEMNVGVALVPLSFLWHLGPQLEKWRLIPPQFPLSTKSFMSMLVSEWV